MALPAPGAVVTDIKSKINDHVDTKVVTSVIAAAVVVSLSIWGLRAIGFKKAAATVSKVAK